MNSRCEDLSSVDQIDSGANSSKEDEVDNNRGGGSSKGDEQEQLRQQSCDQHQGICYTSDQESSLEDGQEHSESNQDTITANTTKCDTKQRGSSLPGSIAQYRLGKSKGIESSTDTLVAELDERNGSNEVNNEMTDQGTTNDIIETTTAHSESKEPPSKKGEAIFWNFFRYQMKDGFKGKSNKAFIHFLPVELGEGLRRRGHFEKLWQKN